MKLFCLVLCIFLVLQHQSVNALDDGIDDFIDTLSNALEKAENWTRKEVNEGVEDINEFLHAATNIGDTSEQYIRDKINSAFEDLSKEIDKIKKNNSGFGYDILQCIEDLEAEITKYETDILNDTLACVDNKVIPFAEDCRNLLEHINETTSQLDTVVDVLESCKEDTHTRIVCIAKAMTDLIGLAIDLYYNILPDIKKLESEFTDLANTTGKCFRNERVPIVDAVAQFGADLIKCVNHK